MQTDLCLNILQLLCYWGGHAALESLTIKYCNKKKKNKTIKRNLLHNILHLFIIIILIKSQMEQVALFFYPSTSDHPQ